MLSPETLLYALLGGILPAILWLWFWLKEDSKKPEPRSMILLSFIAGMIGVAVVFPMEKIAAHFLVEGPMLLLVWAAIEELIKFAAISLVALRSIYFDEPVDALVYMITVALGFAAIENSLFLLAPLIDGDFTGGLLTGNLRYMGATLLHTAASATIGIALGLSFYKSMPARIISGLFGITTAIALHTLFNFFIIQRNGEDTFIVFLHLWVAIVFVIFFFEKVKRVTKIA